MDVEATYLKHISSNKLYVMYTTHEDYCDGGNTLGIIVDMNLYSFENIKNSVVAEIHDGEIYCKKD